MLGAVVVVQAVVLGVGARSASHPMSFGALTLGVLAGVVLPLLLMAVHVSVVVRADELSLALPPFWRRRIRLDRIASLELRDVSPLRDAGGYGLRFRGDGRVALVMRRGPAVEGANGHGGDLPHRHEPPQLLLAALDAEGPAPTPLRGPCHSGATPPRGPLSR